MENNTELNKNYYYEWQQNKIILETLKCSTLNHLSYYYLTKIIVKKIAANLMHILIIFIGLQSKA